VLLQVFTQSLPACEVLVSVGIGNILASLGGAMRTYLAYVCARCISRRCSHASSPRAWAQSRRLRGALCLVYTFPRPPRGTEGEVSATLLTVNSCIKVRLYLQADKSPVVVKGPFFPRVVNPRYRIRGTMCSARIQSSKAR
jgi:hypothetical protein